MASVKGMPKKDVLHLAYGHGPFGLPQLQNLALRLLACLLSAWTVGLICTGLGLSWEGMNRD